MPMHYPHKVIHEEEIPRSGDPMFQHLLDTYASETNKVASVWRAFQVEDMEFRPHPRSSSVEEIMKHELLSERRFFGEFLGTPEPDPERVLPAGSRPDAFCQSLADLARGRLGFLAQRHQHWWLEQVPFFDVRRERIWIFWRRLLHTAHHRTQLAVALRLLERKVPPIYGPTADFNWQGADPTHSTDAAARK